MPTATVRAGTSAWVSQQVPTKAYGAATTMQVAEQSGGTGFWKYPLLWIKSPAPSGVTVTSATLTVYARGASTGARHLTAQRLTQSWKVSTVTYNKRPTAATGSDTVAVGTLATGSPVTIDVTDIVASWASGAANDGLVLSTDTTTTWTIYGYSSAYPPVLKVTWDDPPAKPTHLNPSGGVIGVPAWTCQWAYSDVDGDALQAVRVQTSATSNWTAPDFDSGTVAATHPELALASTAYAGLAAGASTYWRCQAQDSGGAWSVWSDPVQVTYTSPGTVTLTAPTAADPHVHDLTAAVTWTYSGTPVTTRVQVLNASNAIIADSGLVAAPAGGGSSGAWSIPRGKITDTGTYTVKVAVRDGLARVSIPGSDGYARAQQAFTFAAVGTVTVPTALVVSEVAGLPAAFLTWTDTGNPDYFTLYRDGSVLEYAMDAGSVATSGSTYAWTDYHAKVGVTHTYALRGVLAHQASNLSASGTILLARDGIYLTDPATGRWFVVSGQDTSSWAMADNVAVYSPLSSSQRVQVTQGQYGLAGTVSGVLLTRPGYGARTATSMESDLFAMKETPEATYRLVLGDKNIPVKVANLSSGPSSDSSAQNIRRLASYSFFQCGDFEWTPRL